jgi:glycosyltransferase involved in cell wall biosynthesis
VRRATAGAEIFVMPSRLEPFGIVVLEAWDAGRPVVATDRGGTSEFVTDGEDGLLVDPNDLAALAGALDRLADDPALARRLGRAGRAQVPRFSWDVLAQEYRDLYARAVPVTRTGGRSPGP